MSQQIGSTHQSLIVAEAQALLAAEPWSGAESLYREGVHVCILIDPYPAVDNERFQVPVTFLPLHAHSEVFDQIPLLLSAPSDLGVTHYYGRINRRGQVLFRDVPRGAYHLNLIADPIPSSLGSLQLPEPVQDALVASSIWLPALPTNGPGVPSIFHAADGSFSVTLRRTIVGTLTASLESVDRQWKDQLVVLSWSEDPAAGATPTWRTRMALLAWSDEASAYVANTDLGRVPDSRQILLPVRPMPAEVLTPALASLLQETIDQATSSNAQLAWQRFLANTTALSMEVRQVIVEALDRVSLIGQLWRQEAAKLYRLAITVVVQLGATSATFAPLPVAVTPQRVPIGDFRGDVAQAAFSTADSYVELLAIPLADADAVLRLSVGPVLNGYATLVVALSREALPQSIPQARVSLFDSHGSLIESSPTNDDGLVLLQDLNIGAYELQVDFENVAWRVKVSLEALRGA
jgi:hypothetical protein